MERSFTWAWQQQQQQLDDRLAAVTPFYWSRHRCDRSATGCWRPEKFGNNRRKPFNCPLESAPGSFRSSGSSAALPRPIRPFGGVALSTTIGSMEARPISAGRWILSTNSEFVFVRGGIFRVDGRSLWLPSARRTIERMREDTRSRLARWQRWGRTRRGVRRSRRRAAARRRPVGARRRRSRYPRRKVNRKCKQVLRLTLRTF